MKKPTHSFFLMFVHIQHRFLPKTNFTFFQNRLAHSWTLIFLNILKISKQNITMRKLNQYMWSWKCSMHIIPICTIIFFSNFFDQNQITKLMPYSIHPSTNWHGIYLILSIVRHLQNNVECQWINMGQCTYRDINRPSLGNGCTRRC